MGRPARCHPHPGQDLHSRRYLKVQPRTTPRARERGTGQPQLIVRCEAATGSETNVFPLSPLFPGRPAFSTLADLLSVFPCSPRKSAEAPFCEPCSAFCATCSAACPVSAGRSPVAASAPSFLKHSLIPEFMNFFLSGHQELANKQKPPIHQDGRLLLNFGGDFISARFLTTHRPRSLFAIKAPYVSIAGCQTPSRKSFLMSARLWAPLHARAGVLISRLLLRLANFLM